jgi:hypothetical protein
MKISIFGEFDNRPWCEECGDRVDHLHGWAPLHDEYINICDNCYKRRINRA